MQLNELKEIAKGFINGTRAWLQIADPEVEEKAEARYTTCLECDTISEDKAVCEKSKGGCGCPLWMRTRSDQGCPKNNWKI